VWRDGELGERLLVGSEGIGVIVLQWGRFIERSVIHLLRG